MDIERLKELKDYLRVANELSILNDDNLMQRIVDNNDVTDTIDIAIELLNAEIARQSATSEDVAEAIERLIGQNKVVKKWAETMIDGFNWNRIVKLNDLAITALRKMVKPQ